MARYNLYLMDATRDPRVIRRIAALTQVDPRVLAPHLLRFPFLVLREVPLSQAVAVRRELERLGLSLSIENLPPDRITGNSRHPLAGQSTSDETRPQGDGRDQVVLEPGSGFQVLEEDPPEPAPSEREDRGPSWMARVLGPVAALLGHRRVRQGLALALVALGLLWLGYRFGQPQGTPLGPAAQAEAELGLQRLLLQARVAVEQGLPAGPEEQALLAGVQQLSQRLAQAGRSLPRRWPGSLRSWKPSPPPWNCAPPGNGPRNRREPPWRSLRSRIWRTPPWRPGSPACCKGTRPPPTETS
jgi:hypothetical protein